MKQKVEDLAEFGGPPAFSEPLHVGRPNIGDRARLMQRIGRILDSRWLTNDGPMLREFEQELKALLGVRNCVAVSNGTAGLEILLQVSQLEGEVIVPSFTFVATVHALVLKGLRPVFCDIDPETHGMDPEHARRLITPRTVAILGVHLWGRPCAVDALERLASENGLALFFDAAHALGCAGGGRKIGSFGNAEVFSFHATKFINSFEGGAITTNSDELASKLVLARNFGFTGYDRVESLGTNAKMSEVAAAMGLTSLESIDEFVRINRRNHELYRSQLEGIPGLSFLDYPAADSPNFQYVVLEVDPTAASLDREELLRLLLAENVLARRYFYPGCHRMRPYRDWYPEAGRELPHTEVVAARVVCLPTGTAIGSREIGEVCGLIRFAFEQGLEVRRRWRANT